MLKAHGFHGRVRSCCGGYSYRFDNNITLGFESVVISPTARLGYIINDAHHISVAPRYALATQLFFNWGHNHLREEFYKENPELKNTIDVNFHALSGVGVSLMYEYFFPSKRFIRLEARGDYYGADVKIKVPEDFKEWLSAESFKGIGYVWDATVYLGFGTQG